MQQFNTADSRHTFAIDGRTYFLPSPTVDDAIEFSTLEVSDNPNELAALMRDILLQRARPLKRTGWDVLFARNPALKAIRNLGITQTSAIFTAWATSMNSVSLGESSGSVE